MDRSGPYSITGDYSHWNINPYEIDKSFTHGRSCALPLSCLPPPSKVAEVSNSLFDSMEVETIPANDLSRKRLSSERDDEDSVIEELQKQKMARSIEPTTTSTFIGSTGSAFGP